MEKVVSYNAFLKHKDNLETYLKDLFDRIPELKVYFQISLNAEERHLIYTKSKGYLFEKLHKIGSKYSIKLWKPCKDGMNSITEDEYVTREDEYVTREDEYVTREDDYDFKDHLFDISNMLEKQHNIIFNEIQKCRNSVIRLECIFTFIMVFNFVGSVLFLTQVIDFIVPIPKLNTITDF